MTDPMPMNDKGPKVPPTCPPRTPPPQKKPVEAPRSQPSTKPVTSLLPLPGPQQARLDVHAAPYGHPGPARRELGAHCLPVDRDPGRRQGHRDRPRVGVRPPRGRRP